ncbi:hypothetical protein ACHAQA_007097 [Verticillium albo-atrum]
MDQIDNENAGFGVRYIPSSDRQNFDKPVVISDNHVVDIRLHRGQYIWSVETAPLDIVTRFSKVAPKATEKGIAILTLRLKEGANSVVTGFGMPYANLSDPELEQWVNHDGPIVDDMSLLDLVQAREFTLLVNKTPVHVTECVKEEKMPPPFNIPYGSDHTYNEDLYEVQQVECKGKTQFLPSYSHNNDNDHMAIVSQAEVQDIYWVEQKVVALRKDKAPVYFIPRDPEAPLEDIKRFYVIMPRDKAFWTRNLDAWRRLYKDTDLQLCLFYDKAEELSSGIWRCKLVTHPNSIEELATLHPTTDDDLVFEAYRPQADDITYGPDYRVKAYANRTEAESMREQGVEH